MKYYTVENNKKSIFKTFAIYYICMAVFCLERILASIGMFPSGIAGDIVFTFTIQILTLFLLPLFLYCIFLKVKVKEVFKTCNYGKINFSTILISLVLGLLCFFVNVAVSSLFSGIINFTGYRYTGGGGSGDYSVGHFFLEVLLVCILPALCEEFIHRGIVLQGTKHMGFKKAIVISSILFGLLHFNINQVAYAFVVGLILGLVAVVSKNIWPAVIIHFINNFISTYLEYASANNWLFGRTLDNLQSALVSGNIWGVFVVSAIVMIVIAILLCLFIWLLYKQSMIRKVNYAINSVYNSPELNESPIILDKDNVIKDLLESSTLLNLTFKKMDNPIDIVLPKEKSRYQLKKMDKVFLWGAIVMGGLATLFTYIWGLL